jgi:hypothetical protein
MTWVGIPNSAIQIGEDSRCKDCVSGVKLEADICAVSVFACGLLCKSVFTWENDKPVLHEWEDGGLVGLLEQKGGEAWGAKRCDCCGWVHCAFVFWRGILYTASKNLRLNGNGGKAS